MADDGDKTLPSADAVLDMRYYSDNNFVGTRIGGYRAPRPLMTRNAAQALAKAAAILRKQGYRILVYDAYRPQKALDHFVRWINDPDDPGDKSFYPNMGKDTLLSGRYITVRSSHARGSTLDLSIVHRDGRSVDMGGTFDLFDEVSHLNSPKVTAEQHKNRMILHDAMIQAGFLQFDAEWWHFTLADEPYPDTYFNFDVQ